MKVSIDNGIKVLKLALKEKLTIGEACRRSGVYEGYLRNLRKRNKDAATPQYHEFIALYNRVMTHSVKQVSTDEKDDLLSAELSPEEKIKFEEDLEGGGIIDATGIVHVKTLDQIIAEAKIDLQIWEIDRHVINKWDVTNAEGKKWQNWQVKVWLKKKFEAEQAFSAAMLFETLVQGYAPKLPKIKYKHDRKEKNLLELNLFDLHLGKLCWGEEVNNNYDIKIASARFEYALDTLVKRAGAYDFERILFPIGNDFFNSDNHVNTTTMGTRQDEDVRWQKSFRIGHKLLTDGINKLRELAPVDVLIVPGNHDYQKSFYLGEVLSAYYRNDESVMVDNSANVRKYYNYGQVLLGFTHGNLEKHESLRSLMSYEAKKHWANTQYREWHLGHQHRKLAKAHVVKSDLLHEELGVTIRSMSSLAGTDVWHHMSGYVGPVRAAEGFIWNHDSGMMGHINVNLKLTDDWV